MIVTGKKSHDFTKGSKKICELLLFFPVKQFPNFEIQLFYLQCSYLISWKGMPCKHILELTQEAVRISHFDSQIVNHKWELQVVTKWTFNR